MNPWRFVPRKPWHFIDDHEDQMKCIRKILKSQVHKRRKRASFTVTNNKKGKTAIVFDNGFPFGGGAIDIAMERKK